MNSQRYSIENRKKSFLIQAMATIAILAIWTLLGVTFPVVTGCDVGMNMAEEVVGPKTEPDTPAQLEPTTTGEIKQPEETTPGETEEPDKPDDESAEAEKEPDEPTLPACLLYTSPSPRDGLLSRMPSSA